MTWKFHIWYGRWLPTANVNLDTVGGSAAAFLTSTPTQAGLHVN